MNYLLSVLFILLSLKRVFSVDIESYKEKVIAKIESMSDEDLRNVFSEVLGGYKNQFH